MRTQLFLTLLALIFAFSCNVSQTKKQNNTTAPNNDTIPGSTSNTTNSPDKIPGTNSKKLTPLFGYRFMITGDFDGDCKQENLVEHFNSALDNKETNKFYDSLSDYDELVAITIQKKPYSFIVSDNKNIDTLHVSSNEQLLGLSFLKNEGDLNGDGKDEISYVVNWADWSSLNTWHVMTYRNKKWTELYSFPIWDWQIPALPEKVDQYKLFGLDKSEINTNDTFNQQQEKELNGFKGLLKKVKTNRIQVIFRNKYGEEDTMLVNLEK